MAKRSTLRRKHTYKGTSIVPGVAMGLVHLKFRQTQVLSDRTITADEIDCELDLLSEAVRMAKEQLLIARQRVTREIGELEALIFDTHIALLDDPVLMTKIRDQVRRDLKPVEVVVSVIVEGYYRALSMVEDEHLKERAADIRDIGVRLLENLHGLRNDTSNARQAAVDEALPEGDIVFSTELLPSDIATLERRSVSGVITEAGSGRGHCAIMLRGLNIPTVMGVSGLTDILADGDFVIVDGSNGVVYVNPRRDIVEQYSKLRDDYLNYRTLLDSEVNLPARTTDGHAVSLYANVSQKSEVELAALYNMDGIGLYRTEFDLMTRGSFPEEEELYEIYRDMVLAAGDKPITIRTMDIGTDKNLSYIKTPPEENPALGRRSFRLAMELDEYQVCQLRAILRAAVHGNVRLMFPFITSVEDIRLAKRMLRLARRQLESSGKSFNADVPMGMMVEVPAAALSLDRYARDVQFFSVGTNDLVQYVCGADRNQVEVAHWYKGYNPGVLSLLKHVVDRAHENNRNLTICGEMAGDPFYTMFLVGIGVTGLSMSAPQIPLVKKIIRSINMSGAERLADRALKLASTTQIRELFHTTVEQILGRDLSGFTKVDA